MAIISLYQSHGINLKVDFPDSWNDFSSIEIEYLCKLQLLNASDENFIRADFFKFILQNRLKNIGVQFSDELVQHISIEDFATHAYQLLNFVFTENNLTKQPYPTLAIGKKNLVGPLDDFENITCGEFECCEINFYAFAESPSAEFLANIAAILFRPKGTQFQSIENNKLITYQYDLLQPLFLNLPSWKLYAIYTWYCGCKAQLPSKFPTVHESPDKKDEQDNLIFTKCIHSGAGPKNGSRDQIRITGLNEFMFDMEQEAIKAKEIQSTYESQRNAVH